MNFKQGKLDMSAILAKSVVEAHRSHAQTKRWPNFFIIIYGRAERSRSEHNERS